MKISVPKVLLGTLVLSAATYLPFVISDARKENCDKCDYLLVLGGDIIGADTPSLQLFERMKAAADYLQKNPTVTAVTCGGCFRKEQKKSEAAIIADYLIEQGIDKSRIILEDNSTTTFQNFEFGAKLIESYAQKPISQVKVAFLSSNYHVHRALIIAKRYGIKNCGVVACKTPGRALPRYLRECLVAVELVFPQGIVSKQKK